MPNLPISQLPSLSAATNENILPIVNSGVTSSVTFDVLINSDNLLTRNKVVDQSGFTLTFSGNGSSKLNIFQTLQQGYQTIATGGYSHSEGYLTQSQGIYSHAEGASTISSGNLSHAEGYGTTAGGTAAHSEGSFTSASGTGSHAEGQSTQSIGVYSHAEGNSTISNGVFSHSEGLSTVSNGDYSHTDGLGTVANGTGQHVSGSYNVTGNTTSLFVVGCGTDDTNRADAFKVEPISSTIATIVLPQVVSLDYGDDSAAQSAGVPIGGMYHTSGVLKIRLS
jgi:hypothetical protein